MNSEPILEVRHLNVWYRPSGVLRRGRQQVLHDVSFDLYRGEILGLVGESGSGKTTCLRLIAGFEQLSGGAISIFGKPASNLPPWERDVNTVFSRRNAAPASTHRNPTRYRPVPDP